MKIEFYYTGGPGRAALAPLLEHQGDIDVARTTLAAYVAATPIDARNADSVTYYELATLTSLGAPGGVQDPFDAASNELTALYDAFWRVNEQLARVDRVLGPDHDLWARHVPVAEIDALKPVRSKLAAQMKAVRDSGKACRNNVLRCSNALACEAHCDDPPGIDALALPSVTPVEWTRYPANTWIHRYCRDAQPRSRFSVEGELSFRKDEVLSVTYIAGTTRFEVPFSEANDANHTYIFQEVPAPGIAYEGQHALEVRDVFGRVRSFELGHVGESDSHCVSP